MHILQYFADEADVKKLDGLQFWVPEGISSKSEIFAAYGVGLSAPNGYFGENWDAFNDCLLDLQWIKRTEIFIIHREVPGLSCEDVCTYIDILQYVMLMWSGEKTDEIHRIYNDFVPHKISIFFPMKSKEFILSCIDNGNVDLRPPPSG